MEQSCSSPLLPCIWAEVDAIIYRHCRVLQRWPETLVPVDFLALAHVFNTFSAVGYQHCDTVD
uniref:Uncharacterized protein n=1 Tax=Arundo donax TaxID=35708 RepID=A0A0A9BRY0_ARUDO